jgi:hypothetical protein
MCDEGDPPHLPCVLRVRRDRPHCRAAEQGDDLAPPHNYSHPQAVHFLSSGEGGQGAVVGAAGALAAGAAGEMGAGESSCEAAVGGFFFIRFLEGVAARTG